MILSKIVSMEVLPDIRRHNLDDRENPIARRLVATNGCFDILHAGHIDFLTKAKSLGDFLVVGINSDKSVKKLKGDTRPINRQSLRAASLSGLEAVDMVVIFEEDTAAEFLKACWPIIYAKGGDYSTENLNVYEKAVLKNYHVDIQIIPLLPDISTTKIINKIKDSS